MGHVQHSHALKAHQLPIGHSGKLTVQHGSYGTGLTNTVWPRFDPGEGKATAILTLSVEWRTGRKARCVICQTAGIGPGVIREREAAIRKSTTDNKGVNQQALVTAHP
jgi:hypothetical protein